MKREAVKVISEHVKLFHRRVSYFMLPSLDNLNNVTPLKGIKDLGNK